ncbi:flagellar assembly protein FliH [Novosphingobium chloroacetimidivorans]|uniref:Flagellar assembly protein FliH n=1 Tax=Novosphingobium chloroacetimidivorans TaxID=1428314 RepID=A0A7W7NV19_9SPHN|nr:FliH/SctL family protein [Novosphingobium chloroacetimidivorans]MBB4858098.1 flagellar assembly protein FliH [Novosphingobium chloroacetimidivorans]
MSEGYARLSLNALPASSGFRASSRYGDQPGVTVLEPEPIQAVRIEPESDPVGEAFAQGYTKGYEDARAEAEAIALDDSEAAEGLALSFARLDAALEEQLRQRLRDTVAALCEAAITPLTLDEDLLVRRVTTAAAMLARADDDRVIRVHPQDLALIAPRMRADWDVQPDATLERGSIRVEGVNGGVEDGPATWRRAIAEALHQC